MIVLTATLTLKCRNLLILIAVDSFDAINANWRLSVNQIVKVKDLVKKLLECDQESAVAIGSTDSRWSTIGCRTYQGEWFADKTIGDHDYGDVYKAGDTPVHGKPVVLIIP